uniref:G-protein coupled receptors family 3 profile domain-containing protein n=1 Tax=Trichogramma kaykai TaxID=54128 RepID=A0ABD2XHV2_9HYME
MTTTPIATMFSLVVLLLLVSAIAIEDLVCMKNHTFMETSGDAVLSVFIDTDYGPECNISSPRSIQEVATALYVAQQLNRADYVPGVSLGLRIYDTCNDRIAVYKQALVSAVEMDCSAHYDLGLLVPARYGEVLEPLRALDLLPVNTYAPPNLTLPMLDVLVDFLAGRYSRVDLLLADSRPVLDAFLRKSREAGICVKSDKGGLTEAEVQPQDKSVNATTTAEQQQLVVVALGDYEDVTTWLEKGGFGNEDDDDEEDDKKIWIVMTLDNSHVDDKMLLLARYFNVIIAIALLVAMIYSCWEGATLSYHLYTSPPEIKPSIVHYTYPGQNLVFDRRSYENDRRAYVVCDREPRVGDGRRRYLDCEVYLDDRTGPRHRCPIELRMNRRSTGYVKPGSMQLRLLGENKTILSWYDYSMPASSTNRWRLFVVHLKDCLVQEAASEQLSQLRPYGFVVYDDIRFAAIVISDNPASKCYARPLQITEVAMCRLGFDDDRLQNSDGPHLWFEQAMRDNVMSVAPLVDGDPASDHLVVEHFIDPENGFLFAGVSIVGRNRREKTPSTLATYRLLDPVEYNRGADPTERLAYSTRNGYLSICAKVLPEDDDPPSVRFWLTCAQWDRRGRLRYEHKFEPSYRHLNEIAVLNIPGTDGDMLVLTAECEDASCLRAENRSIWLTRMTRRGLRILSGRLNKYGCDGRSYRADAQIFRREEDGLYCASEVCYQDFSANPNRKRTSEFAFDTKCFVLGNKWREVPPVTGSLDNKVYKFFYYSRAADYVPEGSYLIKPEHFVVDLGPDGELDNGDSSDDDIPASTIVRSPHVLSVGKAILEIAKGLRELQQTSCRYSSSSGANEGGGGTSCVLPRFEPELRKPMSNSEVYETLKVPAKSHSTRYVVSRKIDGSLSETTAYQIDSTSARYRVVAEKEQPRLSRLCVRNYTRRCQQSCANFKLLELEADQHDQHEEDEDNHHRVLKPQVWVPILLTITSCATFACCAILAFVVYRYFVEDILDGNPLLTCLLIGATLLVLQSALPFCLEDRAMGAEHLNSRKILVSGLGFGLAFSVMLTRALFLAFSSKGVFSTQHINGYLQCLMLLFMACVELAIATMYFALSDADSARVARSPLYIALLGYDIFLLCSLFASCFFVSHVQRNYREGTCFFATAIGLLICWAVWITCFLLMGQDKRDAIVCSGTVATACLIICGVLVPRTYFMCSHYVRDKSYVHAAAASAMAASRFAGPPPDHLLMDDPRFVNAPVGARQGAYLDVGINGRQPFYEYVSATGSPATQQQQQQQALAAGGNYYYGGGNELVTRPTTSAAALGAVPSHLMTGTTATTGAGSSAVAGKNRGGGMLSRLSFRRGRSPEPRRTPGYSNYGFRPEMRELDVAAANVATQPYVVPRLYVDEPDVSRIQPEAPQQQQAAARAATAASTKKGGPFSKAGSVLSEARYALPRSLLRKKVSKNSGAGAGAAAPDPSSTTRRQPIEPEVFVKEHRSIFNEPYQARRTPSPKPGSALALRDDTIEEEHETQSLRSARVTRF